MKTLPTALVLVAAIGVISCTPGQKQFARSALDVAQTACVIANATMSDERVAELCGIQKAFYEPMRSLLASAKAAEAAKKSAGAARPVTCSGDETHLQCSSSQ